MKDNDLLRKSKRNRNARKGFRADKRKEYVRGKKFLYLKNCCERVANSQEPINSVAELAEKEGNLSLSTLSGWINQEIINYDKKPDQYEHKDLISLLKWAKILKCSKKPVTQDAKCYLDDKYKSFINENKLEEFEKNESNDLRVREWIIRNYLLDGRQTKLSSDDRNELREVLKNCLDSLKTSECKLNYSDLCLMNKLKISGLSLRYRIHRLAKNIDEVGGYCKTYRESNNDTAVQISCFNWVCSVEKQINFMKNQIGNLKVPPQPSSDCSNKLPEKSSCQKKRKSRTKCSQAEKANIINECVSIISASGNKIGTIKELAVELGNKNEGNECYSLGFLSGFIQQFQKEPTKWQKYPSLCGTDLQPLLIWLKSGRFEVMDQRREVIKQQIFNLPETFSQNNNLNGQDTLVSTNTFFQLESAFDITIMEMDEEFGNLGSIFLNI